ncbi:MAG: sugar ABC transporter permease, partial [Planctomycetota bacterium]|nr:sugar ABC transporter permease [Planctomycetota bacterium]
TDAVFTMSNGAAAGVAPAVQAIPAGRASLERSDARLGVALIIPTTIFFVVLIAFPLFQAVLLSFYRIFTPSLAGPYVGLDLYLELLRDSEFWTSLGNNFIWTASTLFLQVTVGIAVAMMLHQDFPLRAVARSLVLFPYLLPMVVAVLVWRWLFNDLYGLLNYLFVAWGLVSYPIDWLGVMPNAMISIVLVGAWKYFPFVVICVLARLQTIPEQLYEAAMMDGANAWQRFWDVTLPQLRGVLVIVILLRAIWDFKEFDLIWLMTGGGPVVGTQTLPIMVYKQAFPLFQLGKAAAVAVIMFIIMLVFMFFYFRTYGRDRGSW